MKNVQKGFTLIELMIVVAIIGILAAVAIPAYGDYTARAQAAEAFTLLDGLKTPMAEQYADNSTWTLPTTGVVTGGKYVASIAAVSAVNGGTLTATYQATGISSKVVGKTVTLTYDNSVTSNQWVCSTNLATNIAPKSCQ